MEFIGFHSGKIKIIITVGCRTLRRWQNKSNEINRFGQFNGRNEPTDNVNQKNPFCQQIISFGMKQLRQKKKSKVGAAVATHSVS